MKTRSNFLGFMMLTGLFLSIVSCSESPVAPSDDLLLKSARFRSATVYPELAAGEEAGILLMREEEKMAHDVYVNFFLKWNLPEFQNIAESETNHYDAVYTLISAYQLTDPSTGILGTFTNTAIAALYSQMITSGEVSKVEALKAAALIEETDISDLQKLLNQTTNPALINVYSNLLRGSRNHLRTFVATLTNYGVTYVPHILDADAFNVIINSPMEPGKQNGQTTKGKGNGNGKGNGKGNGNTVNGSASGQGNRNGGQGSGSQNGPGNATGVCIKG